MMIDPHGNDGGGFDPARHSLASVPEPGGTANAGAGGFPSNDWGEEEQAEEYHGEQHYDERENGYGYDDGGDNGGYGEEYPAPQDARSGGVTFDQPYNSEHGSASSSFRRRSRHHLSKVSRAYDTGGKGFLTPAEQHLRQMDIDGDGQLSNAAVATIMEGKMRGDEIINRLRRMIWMLGGMTLLLIFANLGTAWAVAVMAKDTSLDSNSGEMYVKGAGGDGPTIVTTRGTGDVFVFANFNISARSVYVDDTKEDGDVDQEVGDDDQEDDSLFCITPENAAKIWHDATTGTAVSAMFDFTPPVDYKLAAESAAADGEDSLPPPIDLNSISLQADGAMINETHVCLGTGLPTSRIGTTPTPSFLCIELVSSVCDDMESSAAGESSVGTGASPVADTATSNSFARNNNNGGEDADEVDDEQGGDRRRMLFHAALRNLQSLHPNSFQSSASATTDRGRELVPAQERREGRYRDCIDKCKENNKRKKKCFRKCRENRRDRRKGVFQQAIPRESVIIVSTYTFDSRNPIGTIGTGIEAESRFNARDFAWGGPSSTSSTGRAPVQAASSPFTLNALSPYASENYFEGAW
eukprot:CAMPEP_0197726482 /NCGR_PEP_ID=MMETSP1434-20131217/16113_1 /TAXON_ID=265543 /ORGANISM="Minutocellus polymorphus, Strain CCMP3303" /LENGTH=581 /DNA_ID=CAMNT_0043312435 /DNA_START=116 /DNA_END=1858 /DNA_ORIENTATION=-